MSQDPEVLSIAAEAMLYMVRKYDPTRNVPIKVWIAMGIKQYIWCYWRKMAKQKVRESQMPDFWWDKVIETNDGSVVVDCLNDEDRETVQMLFENRIEKWCIDVVARRHNITVYELRKRFRASESRLRKHVELLNNTRGVSGVRGSRVVHIPSQG